MRSDRRQVSRQAIVALLALGLTACSQEEWLTDMKQQPSVGTWQMFTLTDTAAGEKTPFRGNPSGSVPTTGTVLAGWQVSYQPLPQVIDSMSGLVNPVAADARSLENGHKLYQINCAVCHGDLGDGKGGLAQLNPAYAFAPSLMTESARGRTDGYLFGMLRNGRGLMPSANRIPEAMRWDVINYVRGLQGRYAVATGPVGFPGQTGKALPGYSVVGPTVPAAYVKPSVEGIVEKKKGEGESHGAAAGKADAGHNGGHE